MGRENFEIEFVEDDFSITKTESCPNCGSWMCFFPVIKSIIKKECKNLIDFLKGKDIDVNEVERISIKEWTCHGCKTIFTNISENKIIFKSPWPKDCT